MSWASAPWPRAGACEEASPAVSSVTARTGTSQASVRVSGAMRPSLLPLPEQLRAPRPVRRVGPQEAEAGDQREVLVDVGVADVIVRRGQKARLDVIQPVLEHGEIGHYRVTSPHLGLEADRAIRAA